ncbi:tetratricopeptide repeat protein, partial [Bacteroidetes/Chlorobi group bacterium ChocPot_Mid]
MFLLKKFRNIRNYNDLNFFTFLLKYLIMKKFIILIFNIRKLKVSSKLFGAFLLFFILSAINVSFGLNETQKQSLIDKAWGTVFNEPQATIDLCQKVLSDKSNEKDSALIAQINRLLGSAYFNISDYSKSIEYYSKSLSYYYSKNDQQKIADLNNDIARAFTLINKISESIQYFNNALNIFQKLDKKKEQSLVMGNIGICFYYQMDYVNAVSYYLRALIIADKLKDKELISMHISNIGMIYGQLKNFDKALLYFQKAQKIY